MCIRWGSGGKQYKKEFRMSSLESLLLKYKLKQLSIGEAIVPCRIIERYFKVNVSFQFGSFGRAFKQKVSIFLSYLKIQQYPTVYFTFQ